MSKYDAYWQSKIEMILGLLDEARTKGSSAPLDLPGLDELGQRKTWYGRLDICKRQPTYAPAAPMQSLGRVLSQQLPQWAMELNWRLIVSEDRRLTVRCLAEADLVGEIVEANDEVDTKREEAPTQASTIETSTVSVSDEASYEKEHPVGAFSQRAFDLLEGLHKTPTSAYYHEYKSEFKAEVEEPFRALFRAVADQLPPAVRDVMESERRVFSRFLKNDWGQGGAWYWYWGALYPKGEKRSEAAQLIISITYNGLWWGFMIGDYGGARILHFRQNCQTHASALLPLIRNLLEGENIVSANGTSFTWEKYSTKPEEKGSNPSVAWSAGRVTQASRVGLAAVIAQTFTRLFPLVLLATLDDPMPAVETYIQSLSPAAPTTLYRIVMPAVTVADRSATAQPQPAFSQRAFDLLEGLHKTPTSEYYQQYKAEFKAEVEEPFQALVRAVAGHLPPQVLAIMETEHKVFARILKNDWGQGGAWDFYWGAFYPKGGKRTEDAQLSMWMNYERLEVGFYIGHYGGAQRQRFQHNCERNATALTSVLQYLLRDEHPFFGSHDDLVIGSNGTLASKLNYTWEDFLKDPAKANNDVSVIWPRSTILRTSREEMAVDIARTFTLMFPLVLLATQDDPMPVIGSYVESLGPSVEPLPSELSPKQPEYPLSRCAEDTCMDERVLERWVNAIERKGQAIIYGPPGTGKTYIAQKLTQHMIGGGDGFSDLVQFHPAYAYEDFIQGIRPRSSAGGGLEYPLVSGRFVDFCERAKDCKDHCVLIIDEINRANLARVFGELMFLMEYRDANVPLASGGLLRIPPNVRIIGTMNTADRSIALVDHALRRRFAFLALYPNYDVLKKYHDRHSTGFPVDKLIQKLTVLNRTINDRHYEVGISYFLRADLEAQIEDIWHMEIEPYLEEYFYDQPSKAKDYTWEKIGGEVLG